MTSKPFIARLGHVIGATLIFCFVALPHNTQNASASEVCPKHDFDQLFIGGYFKNYIWSNVSGARKITWSLQNSTIELKDISGQKPRAVSRKFSDLERSLIRLAFKNWDDASEKINFEEVLETAAPDIKIGLVTKNAADNFSSYQWNFGYTNSGGTNSAFNIISGWIMLSDDNQSLSNSIYFQNLVQNAVGHMMGLGEVSNNSKEVSVMKWPIELRQAQSPLSDFDISLIRQRYGESTCPSTYSWAIKEQRARKSAETILADAERQAADIVLSAKRESARITSEATLAAEKTRSEAKLEFTKILEEANYSKNSIISEATIILSAAKESTKTTTVKCSKGSVKFFITSIKPQCPSGFRTARG
jgi:cell division septum initiation protein DivIVA